MLVRYWDHIEADLAFSPGAWDLGTLFREWRTRWRFLLNLIDHLPRTSFFADAMAQDDDLVEQSRDRLGGHSAWRPSVSEWGLLEELVASVSDEVRRLNNNFVTVNSKKGKRPKPPKPHPRPETAIERAKKRWGAEDVLSIVAAVTPDAAGRVGRALGITDE
ncbi:MAG TPA: hypothetical protein VK611_26930 [Acidimicrobiales bacterium]|nr:hypothetical protein [Acidimicrobiales bacterium]